MKQRRSAAIILAAGFSSRMGKQKALLPWGNETLLEYQIEQMKVAGISTIIVVLGYKGKRLQRLITHTNARIIHNEDYESGKSSSIRAGARALDEAHSSIVVSAVDQPVPGNVIKRLIKHINDTNQPAVIPVHKQRRGHPLLLRGDLRNELAQVKEETEGMRQIITKYKNQIGYVNINDETVLYNFNYPSDVVKKEGF